MHKIRIGVLASGGGTNLQALIDEIEKGGIHGEIVLVLSDKKDAYAQKRAEKHGISSVCIHKKDYSDVAAFHQAMMDCLIKAEVELVVLTGFLSILSEKLVRHFEGRIINIHPSLIPAFCGKGFYGQKVHQAVLDYGVKLTGATVHFVDEETDSGPVILQEAVKVEQEDTAETLSQRVLKVEHKLLPEAVKLYCEGKLDIKGRLVHIKE